MEKSALLFTSADTDFLHNEAVKILSNEFHLLKVYRLNRTSPSINDMKLQIIPFAEVDYVFNFLSPKIFPKWLLNLPKIACVNFHPGSYEYPGVGSASYSLYDDKPRYGVTAHYMNETIDSGGIIAERFFDQKPFTDCQSLFARALEECPKLLEDVVNLLKIVEKPPVVQNWTKMAVTRKEFEDWMLLDELQTNIDWIRKIEALSHPKFPGPRIKIGEHFFILEREE